jgi:uncharacterized protein (TIGR00730 family)
MKTITIFCSSKQNLRNEYSENVKKVIKGLNPGEYQLAYGGGTTGLMGIVRSEWRGQLITSNVTKFVEEGVTDTYVFDNIVDRQKKLVDLGNAYLIFPGGYGTHYEMLEVITKNDIKETNKPIFILNVGGIFDMLIDHIKKLIKEGFISHSLDDLNIHIENNGDKLVEIIESVL